MLPALSLSDYDTLLADPPYGIAYRSTHNGNTAAPWAKWARTENFAPIAGDDEPFDPRPFLDVLPKVLLFGANYYASRLPDAKCWLIWDKREGGVSDQAADCELIWTNLPKATRLFSHLWKGLARRGEENVSRQPKYHPHQKPVRLLTWVLRYASSRGVVDPFMGSGSTLLAAHDLNLPAVGVEIEERYAEIAASRLHKRAQQGVLPLEMGA